MIIGEKKVIENLSVQNILSKISEYDVFKYYMPDHHWEINRTTYSPFRKENRPSFAIYSKDGRLSFIDHSDISLRGSCFEFVKLLYNLDYNAALEKIDRDFGLGIRNKPLDPNNDYKKIVTRYQQPENLEKMYSHIQVITRKFTSEELQYWNEYHQDISDLRSEGIYSIKKLYLNRKLLPLKDTELRFGYFYDGHWKIYRPFGNEFKWIPNNVPITMMDGKDNLKPDELAFIQKSKKDYMVIKKLYPHTCAVQNEGWACFSNENVEFLKANSNRQVLSFDSDGPGVKNSKIITEMFNFDYCNVHRYYLNEGIKDWALFAKTYGLQVVEHYLKQKGIIK